MKTQILVFVLGLNHYLKISKGTHANLAYKLLWRINSLYQVYIKGVILWTHAVRPSNFSTSSITNSILFICIVSFHHTWMCICVTVATPCCVWMTSDGGSDGGVFWGVGDPDIMVLCVYTSLSILAVCSSHYPHAGTESVCVCVRERENNKINECLFTRNTEYIQCLDHRDTEQKNRHASTLFL